MNTEKSPSLKYGDIKATGHQMQTAKAASMISYRVNSLDSFILVDFGHKKRPAGKFHRSIRIHILSILR